MTYTSDEKTPEATPALEDDKSKHGKRIELTDEQWEEAIDLYEKGIMRVEDIAKALDVSPSAIFKRFQKLRDAGRKIKFGSKKEPVASPAAPAPSPVASFAEQRGKRIEQFREVVFRSSSLNHAVFAKAQNDIKDGTRTPAQCFNDFRSLRMAEMFLGERIKNMAEILEMKRDTDDAELPRLLFEDLSDEEIKAIQEHDADDAEIVPEDVEEIDFGTGGEGGT
jgi:transposase-like protein